MVILGQRVPPPLPQVNSDPDLRLFTELPGLFTTTCAAIAASGLRVPGHRARHDANLRRSAKNAFQCWHAGPGDRCKPGEGLSACLVNKVLDTSFGSVFLNTSVRE